MGVVIGPRVIDAGLSCCSVLISPVPVAAGYPSPAQDYFDGRIDLNEHLIKDITSTYVVRVIRGLHGTAPASATATN